MTHLSVPRTLSERLSLISGVYSAVSDDGNLILATSHRTEALGKSASWKRALLHRLATEEHSTADLQALARDPDGAADSLGFVDTLKNSGWLMTTVVQGDRPLYSVRPWRRPSAPRPCDPGDLMLSRFTVLRREGDQIVVESPLAWGDVHVHDPTAMALLGTLTGAKGTEHPPGLASAGLTRRMLDDLRWTGLAVPVSDGEDAELRVGQWRAHELWFHRRTRASERASLGAGYGRTRWGHERYEPLHEQRERYSGTAIDLHRPDLDVLRQDDIPLTVALEDRRSARSHDDFSPISLAQLGELLFRCARARTSHDRGDTTSPSRPYPAGGSVYELELYPVVRKVSGLEAGMYHYDPHEHRLRLVREPGREVGRLLSAAVRATSAPHLPQVLLVVTARFGRLMRTYEQMPYSLLLKHVGVLFQTIYLVATSMGLAACALGGGDADAFNEAAGVDYTMESAVGEFMLGSRAAGTD
ncbi:SagB/ThcOx family dehydrogenase [Nonomuraea diastatica]|uniref:SagB/ThcOx family dehydrogenase n=1 Tax=Nonomuraea diastatica TaxID=1848329 RepID=A0A4R4W7D6_9ACTN|nr:SagB family peptide dehydrogenase [Nonomuraea diastatica]TDD12907.1 SagB/ThcOx family dehydrogenase [Nonomuraea diastatica]